MLSSLHAPEASPTDDAGPSSSVGPSSIPISFSTPKSGSGIDKGKSPQREIHGLLHPSESGRDGHRDELYFRTYRNEEEDLRGIMSLVEQELSEPYNGGFELVENNTDFAVYTFRYFIIDWPHLAFLVFPNPHTPTPIATIVCKQDSHRGKTNRGYIAMLSVDRTWRRKGIASRLVQLAISEMAKRGAHEVVLETEYDNAPSLSLYDRLGFLREKRLHRFYSNGKDAFRLILPLETHPPPPFETEEEAERGRWAVGAGSEVLEPISEEDRYFVEGPSEGGGTPRPQRKDLEMEWYT
ncbi:hypothetical protein CI109_104471 [Kwoniella shandongensis]|uniref:Uncharacterized protein n=1 Tax=Kwoniella shandongensis TaxID=1734106 RepID=A0A5M6BPQ1_9TREE|nr:uncharacterized protein CI109_006828 [Kwoniella shandongensis]KAA5524878.1 hypothetical protein CI109_006828 [Kwoniella shandongensis]